MRFFATLALCLLGVAYAKPRTEHLLRQPQFYPGKVHHYDVMMNMTSGVPGMSSQVAKSVIKFELKIYPKTSKDLIIQMQRLRVGQSHPGVESPTDDVSWSENSSLEQELRIPSSAVYENGKITRYSVIPTESLEAQKIRKSILRSLEIHLDEKYLGSKPDEIMPITYNVTKNSPGGSYESHYIITSSPYYDFPYEKNVFNISRFDNYEGIPYIAYKTHHNFEKPGCPEVCNTENKHGAGCPPGHEPHRSPIKRSFVQRYNLLTVGSTLIIDSIHTKETHLAQVYDQNMEVTIQTEMKFRKAIRDTIPDTISGQQITSDINDISSDINEEEIEHICQYPDINASVNKVQSLLNTVAEIVLKNEVQEEKSKRMGEMLVTIQKLMQRFQQGNFRTVQRSIVSYSEMKQSSEKEKIKRQIWIDLLPIIGTSESVSFIVSYIKEGLNSGKQDVSFWESKSILDSLPQNIHRPTEKTINELSGLLEILKEKDTPGHMLFASAHMAVAKVISSMCSEAFSVSDDRSESSLSWRWWMLPKTTDKDNKFAFNMKRQCPETLARKFVDEVTHDLLSTNSKAKRIIYIETLSKTGLEVVLPTLKMFIHGKPHEDIFHGLSRSYIDYVKTATIYSLHNIAHKSPKAVQDILVPVFFNSTEPPKLRAAAFSVILHTKPTLSLLELVAFHSWEEPSEEVGSYVTSSLETFGNSSIPCHQITAQRIKKVIPQVKRFSVGVHKAKNAIFDYWNDTRRIGLLHHIDYMPSNESIIPSAMYGYLGYYTDSIKDNYFEYALLPQGLSAPKIFDRIMKIFNSPAEDIPKSSESKIFSDMNIASRNSEPWRVFAYNKLFYSSSYYYFDEEETSTHRSDIMSLMKDVLDHYIQKDSQGRYSGHFTKLFIPASFHAKTISQSVPYPVQFEKKHPILFSLKVESEKTSSDKMGYKVHVTPSVYSSIIHTNEILNVGDCKRIGVYHEHKTVATYPVTISIEVQRNGRFSLGYQFQELPKNIFSHSSEAGTYAGKNHLEPLPSTEDRRTIKTIPSQFVNSYSWKVLGQPTFNGVYKTEDIEHGMDSMPRTWNEVNEYVSRHVLNAGWRRRSVEIVRARDSKTWTPGTEVVFNVQYSKAFSSQGKSGSEKYWSRYLDFDDRLDKHDATSYATEGQKIYQKLTTSLSHCKHSIRVEAVQKTGSSSEKAAELNMEYFHTPGGFLHFIHFQTSCSKPSTPIQVTGDYAIGFTRRPNEFKYNEGYGQQKGVAIGGISFGKTTPFANPFVVAKAVFQYKPLQEVLSLEVDSNKYEPDTHQECMKDKQSGNYQSPACVKAIREKSIYNNLRMQAIWTQEPSNGIREIGQKIDSALKYVFFTHMNVSRKFNSPRSEEISKSFHLEATYIDKMTHKPVVDIVMEKPTETVNFTKISVGKIRPVSSIESLVESYAATFTNNTYPATCSLTGNFVKTYDMKTYRMPRSTPACSYVLSTHCTENKKFSVLVKHDPNSRGTEEIQIYLGRDEIVLVPGTRNSYKIKYNGQYLTARYLAPVVLNEESRLTAVVYVTSDGGSFIEIKAKEAGVKVLYDGVHVKVQVDPRYKGELCGLCSEFNGEITREYRGVERCLYMNEEDFAKSSIVGQCGDKRPQFKVLCSSDDVTLWGRRRGESDEDEEEEEPVTKQNIVTTRGNELCFSTKPVPVCENSAQPSMTESRQVDFHCLPKQDIHARKLVTEAKRRILEELETKAVDFSESIEVAKMC
ncbi:vitellogenin-6 isoform X2 [Parasteatoda tepidariorum]|uniref:vitellogenin-6 isoform X2 n=1 Tax=Parasteatoda tepidariorum TaxID=114398 RepID=UPI00077F9342|nr:vitellogenin-4 isoform X2 [Parasteatoda tepidariorum]